jgi:hypothetical protein
MTKGRGIIVGGRIAKSRAITRPLTEAQLRVRDLVLAECKRIAANIKRPVKGCK